MINFWGNIEKRFKKKVTIFGKEFYYVELIVMILFVCLSIINIFNFIFALINGDFYPAIIHMFLFCWNTGVIYYNWLSNKMNLILSKYKT